MCTKVRRAEVKRLQEKRMVLPHKRRYGVWWALVEPSIIKAELKRKISMKLPVAEANNTVTLEKHTSESGQPVQYYEPNFHTCFSYITTRACSKEHINRTLGGIKRKLDERYSRVVKAA